MNCLALSYAPSSQKEFQWLQSTVLQMITEFEDKNLMSLNDAKTMTISPDVDKLKMDTDNSANTRILS